MKISLIITILLLSSCTVKSNVRIGQTCKIGSTEVIVAETDGWGEPFVVWPSGEKHRVRQEILKECK